MFLETNEVSRVFKESIKCVSRKFKEQVSMVFLECFNEVFFCNFVHACIPSQLPEQKEGLLMLLYYNLELSNKCNHSKVHCRHGLFLEISAKNVKAKSPSLNG